MSMTREDLDTFNEQQAEAAIEGKLQPCCPGCGKPSEMGAWAGQPEVLHDGSMEGWEPWEGDNLEDAEEAAELPDHYLPRLYR